MRAAYGRKPPVFHLLTDGSCLARLADGSEELEVTARDPLLFPHDPRFFLGLVLPFSPPPVGAGPLEGLVEVPSGGAGEATRFFYASLAGDQRACRAVFGPPMPRIPLGDIS